jgi:hypothetical protein
VKYPWTAQALADKGAPARAAALSQLSHVVPAELDPGGAQGSIPGFSTRYAKYPTSVTATKASVPIAAIAISATPTSNPA